MLSYDPMSQAGFVAARRIRCLPMLAGGANKARKKPTVVMDSYVRDLSVCDVTRRRGFTG